MTWSRGPTGAALHLGVFGKHPGWDDHIEDLGLETERLVRVRQKLYTEGIAGNIDSGAWEKLDEAQRLPGFGHEIVWRTRDDVVIGRLWSSRDGKGRTKYPMAVVAHCAGVPWAWIESTVAPRLGAVERACAGTESADEVRRILDDARTQLRAALPSQAAEMGGLAPPTDLAAMAELPELGPDHVGLHRVLYEIERELGAFRPARADRRTTRIVATNAQHLRVPACAPTTMTAAARWAGLLASQIDPGADIVVLRPHGKQWIDLIVGEPGPAQLFCVKTSETGLAAATSVPYTLEPEFVARCDELVGAWKAGRLMVDADGAASAPGPSPMSAQAPAGEGQPRKRRSWMRWGGAGGAVLIVAGAYVAYQAQKPGPGPGPIAMETGKSKAGPAVPAPELSSELKERQDEAMKRLEAEKEGAAKAERDRLAKEEADRKAKEAADRVAKEQADKAAKDEADRKAREKEESDRKAKEEADRQAKEEADRKAKEEADRKAKEAADRVAKEQADKAAKAEADRKAKDETDRKAREAAATERLTALERRAAGLTARFNAGFTLADVADGSSLADQTRALAADAQRDNVTNSVPVKSVLDRAKGLETIAASADAPALLNVMSRAGSATLAEAMTAWARLSSGATGWPKTGADVTAGASALGALRGAIEAMSDRARAAEAGNHTLEQARAAWTGFVSRAADDAGIEAACAVTDAYAIDPAALPPRERFNVLLWSFKRDAASLSADGADKARAAASTFASRAGAIGAPLTDRPDVKRALSTIASVAAPPPAAGGADVRALGPGARGWRAEVCTTNGRSSVVYTTPADGPARHTLEFVRVEAPSGPVYLCTTEFPVSLFIDVVEGAGRWADVLPTLRGYRAGAAAEEVKGPKAWSFDTSGGAAPRVRLNDAGADPGRGWMSVGSRTGGTAYYPDPAGIAPPSALSPMTYISPVGAAFTATLLGCRLPTSVEWLAASNLDPAAPGNRRDVSWRRVVEFLTTKPPRMQYDLLWPDAGECIPIELSGAGQPAVPQGAKAEAAVTTDDASVWFVPTDSGDGLFKNLIGNVAEYVFEDRAAFDAPGELGADRVRGMIGKGESVRTIGASALSPREIDPTRPYLPRGAEALRGGFSDVGFRLAFSATGAGGAPAGGTPDVVAAVRRAASELKYLAP